MSARVAAAPAAAADGVGPASGLDRFCRARSDNVEYRSIDRLEDALSPTLVDLFAGSGGLSLGLEGAGFETVFVNEVHPDAMQTYLGNRRANVFLADEKNRVADLRDVTNSPQRLLALSEHLRAVHGEIDVVAGGPPCQGFSEIGHRRTFDLERHDVPSNHLFKEMAKFISAVAPRAFLFENVRGLLYGRWTKEGSPGEIWADVRDEFERISTVAGYGYHIRAELLWAKNYGVPQNRPRVLMVGIRSDLGKTPDESAFAGGLLPVGRGAAPDAIDAIGDLVDPTWIPGGQTLSYPSRASTAFQRRARTRQNGTMAPKGAALTEHLYSRHSDQVMERFLRLQGAGGMIRSETKKFAQRVIPERWGANGPNITVTSLPDDYVHFSQPRTLTVREWARLQTFPDWYEFAGKRTTGGRRRAGDPSAGVWTRELPKYTQIGNAVPPALAKAVGEHLIEVLYG